MDGALFVKKVDTLISHILTGRAALQSLPHGSNAQGWHDRQHHQAGWHLT
jgi:hypothetical protein